MLISENPMLLIMVLLNKHLTNFIGIEYDLALQCPSSVKVTFAWIGIFIWLVILITYSGSISAIWHITNHLFVSILLGLVIGWMLCNIYKFIFVVFSATSLKDIEKRSNIRFSKIIACIYVSFIALFISFPIELYLFKDVIAADLDSLKINDIKLFETKTNKEIESKKNSLKDHIDEISHLGLEDKSVLYYKSLIRNLEIEKIALISTTSAKIKVSNYTHKKIEILLHKYTLSKIVSITIILLFLAPMLILFYNGNLNRYHDLKRNKDKQLIDMEYVNFKTAYSQILHNNFQREASWTELYQDPPYDYIKKIKTLPVYLSQKDLLNDIYYEEE